MKIKKSGGIYRGVFTLAALIASSGWTIGGSPASLTGVPRIEAVSPAREVRIREEGQTALARVGDQSGVWTLMATLGSGLAVFEDFSDPKGLMLFVGANGRSIALSKSLESTSVEAAATLYRGHSLQQVFASDNDLLGREVLANGQDPNFESVAPCFPPITKMGTYTFVGTHNCLEKVGIEYGGRTANFDPAAYVPEIDKIRARGQVSDGLLGGWLPVVRFVYPEKDGDWSEMLVYAPLRLKNGNRNHQPVWYRVARVEKHALKWIKYFDSFHPPSPAQPATPPRAFYEELLEMRESWEQALAPGMQVEVPEQRVVDLARHSLVRSMITRFGAFPKYGVFERSYGSTEHDGFQDTFNADTAAMLEWGLFDLAAQYVDNYFTYFVRDDGSILYRGPETGQYGRMLTVLAEYANYTGDEKLLLKHRGRIDAITRLLLKLRDQALKLPATAPAYGMLSGWSEADACLDPDPSRYVQPYFSNSSEALRGFHDLGLVWERTGRKKHNAELTRWGQRLQSESRSLLKDLYVSIERSLLTNTIPVCLPAIAGVDVPFNVAVPRDGQDPQIRSYRAYSEMLHSGVLKPEQVDLVVNYREAHRDIILGVPAAYGYNGHEMGGFLSYGHAYGLLQRDRVRDYLLQLYSLSAHQYTRGTWTAPETRKTTAGKPIAPYCVPAQLAEPLMLRWMLVFEEPLADTLWLCKATPQAWLEAGKTIAVTHAPTRWGFISFRIQSRLEQDLVEATLDLPLKARTLETKLRLRTPGATRIQSVTLNGKSWPEFNPGEQTINLPSTLPRRVALRVSYR